LSEPLVLVDADALGRERTGDESYVAGLLGALPAVADGFRVGAVTRRPELLPDGVEAFPLRARTQELRVAFGLPRLLRRVRPAVAHFLHVVPPACPCPAILTLQDLSFERDPTVLRRWERLVFRAFVPRSARRAARVFAVSERTRRDLVELYGIEERKVVVTPNAVDPAFSPAAQRLVRASGHGEGVRGNREVPLTDYLLYVGAIQARKDPLAAADAARELGMPLVVAGPAKEPELARALHERGAELRGYVEKPELAELYRGAACLVLPSRFEGFGLPVLEAMACGTPVVAADDPALREVGGDAAVYAAPGGLADAIRGVLAERDARVRAGIERARGFSWDVAAERAVGAYREILSR
jgi:glycosyltransferase involved in cell wall biosynthesis